MILLNILFIPNEMLPDELCQLAIQKDAHVLKYIYICVYKLFNP